MRTEMKFHVGQRVKHLSAFFGNSYGKVIAVVGAPDDYYYTVRLDDGCWGGVNGRVVQVKDINLEPA